MSQTKKHSAIETISNVGTGYFVAMALNLTVLPYFADGIIERSVLVASIIGVVYTAISMMRSYIFRRLFNWIHLRNES